MLFVSQHQVCPWKLLCNSDSDSEVSKVRAYHTSLRNAAGLGRQLVKEGSWLMWVQNPIKLCVYIYIYICIYIWYINVYVCILWIGLPVSGFATCQILAGSRQIRKHPSGWLRMVETSTKMSREMRVDDPTKQVAYVAKTHGDWTADFEYDIPNCSLLSRMKGQPSLVHGDYLNIYVYIYIHIYIYTYIYIHIQIMYGMRKGFNNETMAVGQDLGCNSTFFSHPQARTGHFWCIGPMNHPYVGSQVLTHTHIYIYNMHNIHPGLHSEQQTSLYVAIHRD